MRLKDAVFMDAHLLAFAGISREMPAIHFRMNQAFHAVCVPILLTPKLDPKVLLKGESIVLAQH